MHQPVVFVSLGPGDPGLVTLNALKALQEADVVYYPCTKRGSNISSRALDILEALDIDSHTLKPFVLPMMKDRSKAEDVYDKVAQSAKNDYESGRKVAIVAEGDAGFYSSVHYIGDTLKANNVDTRYQAGIPAFIACGALIGLHIAKQEEELHVVPGTITESDLKEALSTGKVLVIMKASKSQDIIKKVLDENSQHLQCHYFENVGIEDAEFYTSDIKVIKDRTFPYFSLIIISQ